MNAKSLRQLISSGLALLGAMTIAQAASISGKIYFDLNGNGARDAASEYGLSSWKIDLAQLSPSGPLRSVTADVNGNFKFDSLPAADYSLSADNPAPWLQTFPPGSGTYLITLGAGEVSGKDFGCKLPGVPPPQIQWQNNYPGLFPVVRQAAGGGYVVGSISGGFGGPDYSVIRLDASGNQMWQRNYGGTDEDWLTDIQPTSDGGFIAAGYSFSSGGGGNKTSANYGDADWWIIRLNADGDKLWETEVGGSSSEWTGLSAISILQAHNGDFLVAGFSASAPGTGNKTAPQFGGGDGYVTRLDSNGNILWDRSYGGNGKDYLIYLVENMDGTILLAGSSASGPSGNKTSPNYGGLDFWLVKTDAAGNLLWDRSFGGSDDDYLDGFAAAPNGDVVLGGTSYSGISGNKTAVQRGLGGDCWLVRVDVNGNEVWQQTYGGNSSQYLWGLVGTPDGGFLLAGETDSPISGNKVSPFIGGNSDAWAVKLDANGNHQWDLDLGGTRHDSLDGYGPISLTSDGGFIVTGGTLSTDGNTTVANQGGQGGAWVVKFAPLSCPGSAVTLLSATADCALKKITLNFSAPLTASALQTAHYSISGGLVSVQGVTFGANTLAVELDTPALLPGVIYTVAVSGLVGDCGNPIAANAQITVACLGEIHGRFFSDQNHDCIQGPGEFVLPNRAVQLSDTGGARVGFTDHLGNYSFKVPAGSYTVGPVPGANPDWALVCPGATETYQVTVTNGQIAVGKDFGLAPLGPQCADLWVSLTTYYPGSKTIHGTGASTPCCGTNFIYHIDYGNRSTASLPAAGTIQFFYTTPACTIVGINYSAFPLGVSALHSANPGAICPPTASPLPEVFTLPTLNPGDAGWIDVTSLLCCDGAKLCTNNDQITLFAQATILPVLGDCLHADNFSFHQVQPCCSEDPNDCTVTPKGCGPEGLIHSDQALTYLVQFQNLGGGQAHLVVVSDMLDPGLDLDTVEILGSSHANLLERNGREMLWTFPEIDLASVSVNENASHGYVKFRVRPLAGAPAGTVIANNAVITFDVNAPITTITTTNTITDDPVPIAAFEVVPQPGLPGTVNDFIYTGGTPGATCLWDFGPDATPQTSTLTNPTGVAFNQAGPHLVSLRTSLGSCQAEPAVQIVTVGRPELSIVRTTEGPSFSWAGDGYRLQEADSLRPPIQWTNVVATPTVLGGWHFLQSPNPDSNRFYRLLQAP